MTRFEIRGHVPLRGSVRVSGSRQAALWMIAASLLTTDKVTLTNVPHIRDVEYMLESLRRLGVAAGWTAGHEVTIHAAQLETIVLPSHLPVSSVASALFFGALLVRSGQVRLLTETEGGLHQFFVYQLEQFGAYVEKGEDGYQAEAEQLKSAHIVFPEPTVVGTVQAIFLAVMATGQTVIEGAAAEPEVDDLLAFFQVMGAQAARTDERLVVIEGVPLLHGLTYSVMPDRVASVAYGVAALLSEGDVLIKGARSGDLLAFLAKLQQLGANYKVVEGGIRFWAQRGQLYRPIELAARPYPGISATWLPLLLPLLARVDGISVVRDLPEADQSLINHLGQFGMESRMTAGEATIFGPTTLTAATVAVKQTVEALAVCLASLASNGVSVIEGGEVLDFSVEQIEERLVSLGARIERIEPAAESPLTGGI